MSPPSPPNQRSHLASASSYSSTGRRPMYGAPQSTRQTQYSSLGDALGGMRQPQQYPGSEASPEYPSASVSSSSVPQHPHLPQDTRTQYTSSGLPSYEYSYQPGSYEPISQYSHSSLPPMRTASPAAYALNQPITQYNTHGAPYAPPYSQASYVIPEEEWGQSPQSFTPDTVQPVFVPGRSEVVASPQIDTRPYVQQPYPNPQASVHPEERGSVSGDLSPSSKGKGREQETGRTYRSPSSTAGTVTLDYTKLLSTYNQLYNELHAVSQRGAPGNPDVLDEIDSVIRTARFGLQLLQPSTSPTIPAEHRRASEESVNSADRENVTPQSPSKRQAESAPSNDGQKCLGCGATATPEWRRGPLGPRTLCNACGLVYAKMIKKRGNDPKPGPGNSAGQRRGTPAQSAALEAPPIGSPGGRSDDESSYGSQDPH